MVAREYLVNDGPDAIINIVGATNLERNLYLTTQLLEIGIPVVIALNMMDVVKRSGDTIHSDVLSKILKCPVVEISALKETNIDKVVSEAILAAGKGNSPACISFDDETEGWLSKIQSELPEEVVGVLGEFAAMEDALAVVEEGGSLAPIAALFGGSAIAGYAFLAFNLLCAPCFAAINTIRAEMKSGKWFGFAIAYQCVFSYIVALLIYQFGMLFTGGGVTVWTIIAFVIAAGLLFMLFRPGYKPNKAKKKVAATEQE